MAYHNATCGCADYGNYGQVFNPRAIHNQSYGCAECGNYDHKGRGLADAKPEMTPIRSKQVSPEDSDSLAAALAHLVNQYKASNPSVSWDAIRAEVDRVLTSIDKQFGRP